MIPVLNARWPQRLVAQNWGIVLLVLAIGGFGALVLYSAAGGSVRPWALNHGIRLIVFTALMLALGLVTPGLWLRLAYPIYGLILAALVAVEIVGFVGGGAQRWLDIGILRLQPSELMKLAVVLALARFYHFLPLAYVARREGLLPPLALIAVPVVLVLLQPDLGTSLAILIGGATVIFFAGLPLLWFLVPAAVGLASLPLVYQLLHPYQQRRIDIFLNPELDPLGAGYHITQAKIAIGSGGLRGKGFLEGSQSHLAYLPEPHTDFIFATMAEEWGLVGGLLVLLAYGLLLRWGLRVAIDGSGVFQRLAAGGLVMTIFVYIFINLMMVMGLAPVVGIPLPLMSFGGSAMMTVMVAIGILLGIDNETRASKRPGGVVDPA
ncbi:rod shape-determining protein RodA [Thermaurantiacus sp.]